MPPEHALAEILEGTPIKPGDVNIFIGENGAGKSTIIDMIRALADQSVLVSLPAQGHFPKTPVGYSVEFEDGARWSYVFESSRRENTEQAVEHMCCSRAVEIGGGDGKRNWISFELNKWAPVDIPKASAGPLMVYRNGMGPDEIFDDTFIFELNKLRSHLLGVSADPSDDLSVALGETESFVSMGDNLIGVSFSHSKYAKDQLHTSWLPAGWKASAALTAWLSRCPCHSVCLIEEPETHLHPTLIRLLMRRLLEIAKKKELQLFISTHSPALINCASEKTLTIFQAHGSHLEQSDDLGDVFDRMGCAASDILQVNCVIWVEGPSDRIYLNKWIAGMNSGLVEGMHYAIMFYGGRLLSHIAADSKEVGDLIALTKLSRYAAILIDSDKGAEGDGLTPSKKRVIESFEQSQVKMDGNVKITRSQGKLLAWVTAGREIENYLDEAKLGLAIADCHPSATSTKQTGKFAKLLELKRKNGDAFQADKVDIAQKFVSSVEKIDYDVLDLRTRMNELCALIKRANSRIPQ